MHRHRRGGKPFRKLKKVTFADDDTKATNPITTWTNSTLKVGVIPPQTTYPGNNQTRNSPFSSYLDYLNRQLNTTSVEASDIVSYDTYEQLISSQREENSGSYNDIFDKDRSTLLQYLDYLKGQVVKGHQSLSLTQFQAERCSQSVQQCSPLSDNIHIHKCKNVSSGQGIAPQSTTHQHQQSITSTTERPLQNNVDNLKNFIHDIRQKCLVSRMNISSPCSTQKCSWICCFCNRQAKNHQYLQRQYDTHQSVALFDSDRDLWVCCDNCLTTFHVRCVSLSLLSPPPNAGKINSSGRFACCKPAIHTC